MEKIAANQKSKEWLDSFFIRTIVHKKKALAGKTNALFQSREARALGDLASSWLNRGHEVLSVKRDVQFLSELMNKLADVVKINDTNYSATTSTLNETEYEG